jgi:hypothetical protein
MAGLSPSDSILCRHFYPEELKFDASCHSTLQTWAPHGDNKRSTSVTLFSEAEDPRFLSNLTVQDAASVP